MRTLLLNGSFEPLSFIPFKRLIKLVINDKVEIVENWNEHISWVSGKMEYPATVRLRYYIKGINRIAAKFNRHNVFRRDIYSCQYCGAALSAAKTTIDHIVPTSLGGKSSYSNCVACCFPCNMKKGNKTPEQAGMVLLNVPTIPKRNLHNEYIMVTPKHISWEDYFEKLI